MSKELTQKMKSFCHEYIIDWNATRSYKAAGYSANTYNVAGVEAHKLLKNPKVQAYIEDIQSNLEKEANISRLRVLKEYQKIAFTSIAHMHNTWIERKKFEELTEEQKSCIESIDVKTVTLKTDDEEITKEIEHVKIKLYDKQKALESISKMLGYNEPEKLEHSGSINIDPFSQIRKNSGIDESK